MKYPLALAVLLFLSISLSFFPTHHAFAADDENEEEPDYVIVVKPKKQKGGGGGGCASCGNITVTVTDTGSQAAVNYKVDRPSMMTNDEKALFQRCKQLLSQIGTQATIAGVRRYEFENNVHEKNAKTIYMEALDEQKDALDEYKEAGCDSFLDPKLPELVNNLSETGGHSQ